MWLIPIRILFHAHRTPLPLNYMMMLLWLLVKLKSPEKKRTKTLPMESGTFVCTEREAIYGK